MKKIIISILTLIFFISQTNAKKMITIKEEMKKYNHPIQKEGVYRGKLISWDIVFPNDPTIPSGGNPYFVLRIKGKNGKVLDTEFYTLKFKRNSRIIADSDRCYSKGSQIEIHNCKYDMHRKYLKRGRYVDIKVVCSEDSGCYTTSVNIISKKSKKRGKVVPKIPIRVGGEPDLDACNLGIVRGLRKNGFLAVRSGPSTKYRTIDRLQNGDRVYLCDTRNKGRWVGIVYGDDKCSHRNINISSIIPKREIYRGSCNTGWSYYKYFDFFE
jgi:uncharacterized protein YgiM (DUF1202 family)